MAYDEGLAERVREALCDEPGASERAMFGGIAFMLKGNMCCGVVGEELMVRVGAEAWEGCLAEPHAREMDFTGRSLKGMIYVATEGIEDDADLAAWVARGVRFAGALPAK